MEEGDLFEERTRITFEAPQRSSKSPSNSALVTFYGSEEGFANIQQPFCRDIAAAPHSWKRTYGQVREVYCHVQFEKYRERVPPPMEQDAAEASTAIDFSGPILHSFWCDSQSADAYRAVGKSQIASWLEQLEAQHIQDWIIIVFVRPDIKRTPRTRPMPKLEIFDRVSADFCTKARDRGRCVFLMDPRSGLGDADAWHSAVVKFRQLIYDAYETKLRTFEERLRIARELRSRPDFKLSEYVSLRETLASAYQRLSFPEEALLHLDELAAIMSQFVADASQSPAGPTFRDQCVVPPKKWLGLNIANKSCTAELREVMHLGTGHLSLLDLRCFLFVRQYELLVELNRAWEVTLRAMPFIQNVTSEARMFNVPMISGALDCWTFLTCHEIRQLSQKGGGDGAPPTNQQDNATLLGLEREKLAKLGTICGLMPNQKPTDEQRNLTDALSQAMSAPLVSAAVVKLYEALLSSEKFMKSYLEMAEMTMGTFKHIGRTRAAKLLGIDLAKFYMEYGAFDKASGFLLDVLKMLRRETWALPCADVARLYNKCVTQTKQWDQVIKSALLVASCGELDLSTRLDYMDMFSQTVAVSDAERDKVLLSDGLFLMSIVKKQDSKQDTIVLNQRHQLQVTINSTLPRGLPVQKCMLVLRSTASTHPVSSRSPIPDSENFFMDVHQLDSLSGSITCIPMTPKADTTSAPFPGVKCTAPSAVRSFRAESFDIADDNTDLVIESAAIGTIEPGQQTVTFSHQFEESDSYRIAELHVQYSDSFKMVLVSRENFMIKVLRDAPLCSLTSISSSEKTFWMHTPYTFRLSFSGEDQMKLGDIAIALQSSDEKCVKIGDQNGDILPGELCLSRTTKHSTQVQLSCAATEPDYVAEVLVRVPWKPTREVFRFHFHSPLKVVTSAHFCAPSSGLATTLITVAVTNRWSRAVSLGQSSLFLGDRPLTSVSGPTKVTKLVPNSTIRLIWLSQAEEMNASGPFLLKTQYSLDGAEGLPYSLSMPFSAGVFGATRLTIALHASPEMPSIFCVGEVVNTFFTVTVLRLSDESFPVFYQIKYDQCFWTSTDEASGILSLRENEKVLIQCHIMPCKAGNAVLPTLRLFYVKEEDIVPIDAFHVYNESIYSLATIVAKQAPSDFIRTVSRGPTEADKVETIP
ncbi:Trafficking protein particle complex subunit 10 [Hypsibius exemplaris]|uniref:Trafficking protein particle complex subunit 10 n=1 Tax=Hypsibius exemplaris TaxID=2072580 RepID=A0A1W0W9W4_HYPEX|nr:Trafficking protein particle complex subunit 10 [Hypsibius exemplaris]